MNWGVKGFCKCGTQFTEDNCPISVLKKGRGLCRKCNSSRMAEWTKKNPDKSKTYKHNRRKERPEEIREYDKKYYYNVLKSDSGFILKRKEYHRKTKYGMVNDTFESLLKSQDNRCAICHKEFGDETPCVDHCHATNKNRGLLCGSCNKGLGHFFESSEALISAVNYLKKYETN